MNTTPSRGRSPIWLAGLVVALVLPCAAQAQRRQTGFIFQWTGNPTQGPFTHGPTNSITQNISGPVVGRGVAGIFTLGYQRINYVPITVPGVFPILQTTAAGDFMIVVSDFRGFPVGLLAGTFRGVERIPPYVLDPSYRATGQGFLVGNLNVTTTAGTFERTRGTGGIQVVTIDRLSPGNLPPGIINIPPPASPPPIDPMVQANGQISFALTSPAARFRFR